MATLQERLKYERGKKNLSQREFAKLFNIAPSTIASYETGARKPDLDTLKRLANFFNVTTDYLLGETDNPKSALKLSEKQLPKELQGLGIEYITLARELQEGDFSPEDIRKILKAVESVSKKKNKNT